jgi:pimeloyl-ACP methyl ester carboxylesterase
MSIAIGIVAVVLGLIALLLIGLAGFTAWTARNVEKALPAHGRFIEVDGTQLHYYEEGSGPPLVLIHGLAGQTRVFTHSLLDRLKAEHRVIIIDRPGCGYSARPRGASAAISAQARTIARFIEALGVERPLVVGHSLGGAIALSLALNHPEHVSGLALIAPLTHSVDEVAPLFRGLAIKSALLRGLVGWTSAVPISIRNRKFVLETAFGPEPPALDYGTRGGGLLNLRPHSFINASRDLMAAADGVELVGMEARYQHLTVPVGVLFGTADQILDATKHGAAMATKVAGLDLELIEDAGHMIVITAPDRSAKFITRMARRAAAAARPASTADLKSPPT